MAREKLGIRVAIAPSSPRATKKEWDTLAARLLNEGFDVADWAPRFSLECIKLYTSWSSMRAVEILTRISADLKRFDFTLAAKDGELLVVRLIIKP